MKVAWALLILTSFFTPGYTQAPDYSPQHENTIQKIKPGRQMHKDDQPCGKYFWTTVWEGRIGPVAIYYFFGNPAYGKSKLGIYRQSRYHVILNEEKDPPTVQVIQNDRGTLEEVRVRMTKREFEDSRACFPEEASAAIENNGPGK